MSKLFDDDGKYLPGSRELLREIAKAVRPIMKSYADAGYSMREVSHISLAAISDYEAEYILSLAVKKRKET